MFTRHLGEFRLRQQRPVIPLFVEALESRVLMSASALFVAKTLVDHSVKNPGESFNQYFTLRNNSIDTAWIGYRLVLVSGCDRLGAASSISLPFVAPNQQTTIAVPLQAVKTSGGSPGAAQLAFWEMQTYGGARVPISGQSYSNPVARDRVWTSITINAGYGQSMPNLSRQGYVSDINPYVSVGNGGQCTAYVWGRVHELFGISLSVRSGAGQSWVDTLTGTGKYQIDKTPSANSIAVWSGHVAYVETVIGSGSNATVLFSEANWSSNGKYADLNDPKNNQNGGTYPWWGGGYEGNTKSLSAQGMETRGQKLIGYIHLR